MITRPESPQRFLFIGDSITDASRRERDVPLGVGYVRMFSDLHTIRQPDCPIEVINKGISGNNIDDLRSRWADHVLAHRPDWLVVKIGINDLNHHLMNKVPDSLQCPEKFAIIYDRVIALTRRELPEARILVVSPFFLSRDAQADSYRTRVLATLPAYIQAGKETSQRHGTLFLDLQNAFESLLNHLPPDALAEDAVHPSSAGALFIAEQIYAIVRQAAA